MQVRAMGPLKPTELMKETIFIKTNRLGYIPQIRMQGPIVTPIPITREAAKAMIVAGIEVFEVYKDKSGTKQVRLLTLQNVYPGEGEEVNEPVAPEIPTPEGEQKPQVPPSTGVVQQEPVQPVKLKGVSISEEKVEEKPEKHTTPEIPTPEKKPEETTENTEEKTEEKEEEKVEEPKQNKSNSGKGGKSTKNKNKNK